MKMLSGFAVLVAVLSMAFSGQAQTTTSQPLGYGAISGRVEADDGPLSFASVTISPAGPRVRGAAPRTVVTDAEGNFKLNGLRPIAWSVSANVPGYVPAPGANDGLPQRYHQVGETVNVRMIKGGVITGRVLNAAGEPVVAIKVSAQMIRDPLGKAVVSASSSGDFQTDDRGAYRIYGLASGVYVVSAGASSNGPAGFRARPYEGNAPIFHPASARETAADVSVASGSETQNIDIQYRSIPGHGISGTISNKSAEAAQGFASVTLAYASSGAEFNRAFVIARGARGAGAGAGGGFSFQGVPDGQYQLTAYWETQNGDASASAPRLVTVSGRDVGGVELTLTPLASVTARVQIEPGRKCDNSRPLVLEAQVFDLLAGEATEQKPNRFGPRPAAPNRAGEMVFRDLSAGRYRIVPNLLDPRLYLHSITSPTTVAAKAPARAAAKPASTDLTRSGLTIKSGERLAGVAISLADGAASIRGRVKPVGETPLPTYLTVQLAPVEPERAEDVLQYAESRTIGTPEFSFGNLAPGKYWILTHPTNPNSTAPTAWNPADRLKLRKDAERQNQTIELSPCQQKVDIEAQYRAAGAN